MTERERGPFRAAVVGCHAISNVHLTSLDVLEEFEIAAVADTDQERTRDVAAAYDVGATYTDYEQMLRAEKPDVVVVATPNDLHARMTIQAVEAGARGVCCEKPMAVSLAEGRAMVTACRQNQVSLIVSHQRRLRAVFQRMRELIVEGAIGQLQLIRGSCAGDLLTDGTHVVDTIRHLVGDQKASWVLGQVYRVPKPGPKGGNVQLAVNGYRYGHPVETGGMAVIEFEDGVRAELLTGDVRLPGTGYCHIEAVGTEGKLLRAGDTADPPLLVDTGKGWGPVEVGEDSTQDALLASYRQLARMMRDGESHPLSGESALDGLEILMAIFESARTHSRVELPIAEERFPLELMVESGEL